MRGKGEAVKRALGPSGVPFWRAARGWPCLGLMVFAVVSFRRAAADAVMDGPTSADLLTVEVEAAGEGHMEEVLKFGVAAANPERVSSRAKTRFPTTVVEEQPERMVVIGDVHGDIGAFERTLRMAGLVDEGGHWSGGKTVLVQDGDIFDRGDADLEVEEWLWVLEEEAHMSGGSVLHMLGNHEVMNAMGDHSTASRASFKPFEDLRGSIEDLLETHSKELARFPEWAKPRLMAMAPSGPVANMLASHSIAMKVGDTLFVHGGLLPGHIEPANCMGFSGMECLEDINRRTHLWLLGKGDMPQFLMGAESPVWSRYYSMPAGQELGGKAQADLNKVLEATGTMRMIVGHTPQEVGINSAGGGKLWRTDTGMTAMIGGQPEALEIAGGMVTVITPMGRVPAEERACQKGKKLPLVESEWTRVAYGTAAASA